MTPEIAALQVQIAAIQAHIEWLIKIMWWMVGLNSASFLTNGIVGAMVHRNNKSKSK